MILKYVIEYDDGDDNGKHEKAVLKHLGSALWVTFGEDYRLFTMDGRRVTYDSWSDDGHHEGHDPSKAVVVGDPEDWYVQRFGSVFARGSK